MQTKNIAYHNLDITVGQGNRDEYPVSAYSTICGEDHGILRFPYSNYEELCQRVDLIYTLIREMKRGGSYHDELMIQQFGQELFESLLTERIMRLYVRCIDKANSIKNGGLRLRIHINDPELAIVPWEYLYDPDRRNYVAVYHNTPIVRYMDIQRSTTPPRVKMPLRLLCMISSPTDLAPLDVNREKELLLQVLNPLIKSHKIEVGWLDDNPTYDDLQRILRKEEWHIFHFIGHGGFDARTREGYICCANSLGDAYQIKTSLLTPLLECQRSTLKLVCLNACEGAKASNEDMFSSIVGGLMVNGVLSVIAMQQKITDGAAIVFSHAFYSAIADGLPIDASMSAARIRMNADDRSKMAWGIPALYMRAPNGVLFRLSSSHQTSGAIKEGTTSARPNDQMSTRKRSSTSQKDSAKTLEDTADKADKYSFKKSLPKRHRYASERGQRTSPLLQFFTLDIGKKKRYRNNVLALMLFLFFLLDVIGSTFGVNIWSHSTSLTIAVGIITFMFFAWGVFTADILADIVITGSFGLIWCILELHYIPFVPMETIIMFAISILFVYVRFLLFKPTQ